MKPLHVLQILPTLLLYASTEQITHESGVSFTTVYYEPGSELAFPLESQQNNTAPTYDDHAPNFIAMKTLKTRRVAFRSNGCSCQNLVCGCCTGINIQQFNFNREGCMNFTYNPFDFAIEMDVYMNTLPIFSNKFSAKNPPPLCIPVPIPYLPTVDFCARLFEVYTPGQNLHMCLDFETRIQRAPVLVLHFDCMRMGSDGVAVVKPGDPGLPPSSTTDVAVTDVDGYDEVTEIKRT